MEFSMYIDTHDANTHMIITMYTGEGKSLSRVWLFATPWAVAYQAPLSME